jgi:hypothetical protein
MPVVLLSAVEPLYMIHTARPDIFCPMPLSTFLGLEIANCDILGRIHAANILSGAFEPTAGCFKLPKSSLVQLC